jgi:AAA-like domain
MTVFPLRYARGNLLIGRGGEAAALYRLDMVSYPHLPVADKWLWQRRLERLAYVVGADFSLWRVQRAYPAGRYPAELEALLDDRGQDPAAWRRYLNGHAERLAGLASHVPELYLAVSLAERQSIGFGASFVRQADRGRRRLEDMLGVAGARPISGAELEALATAEQRLFERLRGVVSLRRAQTRELEWLLRRAAVRGIAEPRLDPHWQPDALVVEAPDGRVAYEPLEHDLWRCANAPVREEPGRPPGLTVEAEEGTSHQAFVVVGALAEEAEFPGPQAELLYAPLEAVGFPVDACLHCRWLGNREALAQVRKRILDVEDAFREQVEGSARGPGWLAEEDRVLAREYEAILGSGARPPMLYGWISLAVGASEPEQLERRVAALTDAYGDLALHRPRGLQERLFFDHLPRPDGGATTDYVQQLTVEQFGALMPLGTRQVGSVRGAYIGYAPEGRPRPVRYDPTAPSREARTSAVLLAGTLGSGKTVAAQSIAYAAERRGSLVVDFDPKPDHGFDRVPELADRVRVLELSGAEQHRGALDPLAIGLSDLREELCASYFLELLREPPPSWENAIGRAVREVARRGGRSSLAVIEELRQAGGEAAVEAADALEVVAGFGLARLGFGDGKGSGLVEAAAPVTTIRTPGLVLPDPRAARETYTRSERVSVATLSLVAALALRLVSGDRSRHKLVLLDEAWFLLASAQGRTVINRLVRLARAFNATVLLATQRLEDLGDLSELVGTYFIFGQESDAEARSALELVGTDPGDRARLVQLKEFRKGRCLMRDLDGRVGEVQFDLAFPELLEAFDTTPKREAG